MPTEILMPALSPTMEKGKLAKWLVKEGDEVSSGDIIAEIETDKATMEVEAVDEGRVGKLLVAEGTDDVAVNTAIAVLLGDGESAGDIKTGGSAAPASAPKAEAAPAPKIEIPCCVKSGNATGFSTGTRARCTHLCFTTGEAHRETEQHRNFSAERHRPAWPYRQIGRGKSPQGRRSGRCAQAWYGLAGTRCDSRSFRRHGAPPVRRRLLRRVAA